MPGNPFSLFQDWHVGDPIGPANIDPANPDDPSNIPHQPGFFTRAGDWWARNARPYGDAIARAGQYLDPPSDWRPPQAAPSAPRIVSGGRGALRPWQSRQAPQLAGRPDQNGLFPRFYTYGSFADGGPVGGQPAPESPRPAEQLPEDTSPHLYRGPGPGQADNIDAKVSPGEYIWSAEDTAMLGDGSSEEGARVMDRMRGALRMHKTGRKGFPPKARNPLSYLREAR